MSFKFEKLIVWQKAVELAADVHDLTRAFPKEELSNAEFNKFLGYALRSDIEVVGCLFLAQKRNMIEPDAFVKLYHQCEEILAMLNALRKTLKEKN